MPQPSSPRVVQNSEGENCKDEGTVACLLSWGPAGYGGHKSSRMLSRLGWMGARGEGGPLHTEKVSCLKRAADLPWRHGPKVGTRWAGSGTQSKDGDGSHRDLGKDVREKTLCLSS